MTAPRTFTAVTTVTSGGDGVLRGMNPPPIQMSEEVPVALAPLANLAPSETARASLTVERLASYRFNTVKVTVGGELPCSREELLGGAAHRELEYALAGHLHAVFDEGLFPLLLDSVEAMEARRGGHG